MHRTLRLLALLCSASVFTTTAAHARRQPAPGIVRIRNSAQLPIAAFELDGSQRLADKHLLPGRSVDVTVQNPGTYRVTCKVGYRSGASVDVIFPKLCSGSVTVRAGEVSVYVVPRIKPEQVLSQTITGVEGGDPAFGGPGVTDARYKAPMRNADGSSSAAFLAFSPAGKWFAGASRSTATDQGTVGEVSWPDMSTKFTFSLNGKRPMNVAIDRPYQVMIVPNGPSQTGTFPRITFLTYTFCGMASGPEQPMFPGPSAC